MGEPIYKLVPVEPTAEMIAAAAVGRVLPGYVGAKEKHDNALANTYRAMVEAAPAAPAGEPVAWMVYGDGEAMKPFITEEAAREWVAREKMRGSPYLFTLATLHAATHPPAGEQTAWVRAQWADGLARIYAQAPRLENPTHGPRWRCRHCGHAWVADKEAEHHSEHCAWIIARAALAAHPPAPAQPVARQIEDCPELNLSNYDADDVDRLNDWAIRADAELERLYAAAPAPQERDALKPTKGGTNDRKGH